MPELQLRDAKGDLYEVSLLSLDENGEVVRLGFRKVDGPGHTFVTELLITSVEPPQP